MSKFLPVVLLLVISPLSAGVYKWVDQDGVVHYSDHAAPNAEEVKLPKSSRYQPVLLGTDKDEKADDRSAPRGYKDLAIASPQNNETIRSNEGEVQVGLLLDPGLKAGDKIQIVVDGNPLQGNYNRTQLVLKGLNRGSHSLQARILGKKGTVIARSPSVTFHLRKASILEPGRQGAGDSKAKAPSPNNTQPFAPNFSPNFQPNSGS